MRAKAALSAARDGPLDDYEMLDETSQRKMNAYTAPTTFRSNSYVEVVEKHMMPKRYDDGSESPGASVSSEQGGGSVTGSMGEENEGYELTAF